MFLQGDYGNSEMTNGMKDSGEICRLSAPDGSVNWVAIFLE
jgi:hypothetical protein